MPLMSAELRAEIRARLPYFAALMAIGSGVLTVTGILTGGI